MSRLVRHWPWIVLLVGMLCMTPALLERHRVERANDTYELSLPDDEITALVEGGIDTDTVHDELIEAGMRSVGVEMLTIPDLERQGRLTVLSRTDLTLLSTEVLGPFRSDATFLVVPDEDAEVLERIERAAPPAQIEQIEVAGRRLYQVTGAGDLETLPLGYDDERIEDLIDRGVAVIARVPDALSSVEFATSELARIQGEYGIDRILFSGDATPFVEDSDSLTAFAAWLRDEGFSVLLIEFAEQPGIDAYARIVDRAIRLHGLSLVQEPDPPASIDRAIRAVKERNLRVLFLRPTPSPPAPERLEELVAVLSGISDRMPAEFRNGVAVPFDRLHVTPLLLIGGILVSAGIAGALGAMVGAWFGVALAVGVGLFAAVTAVTGAGLLADVLRLGVAIGVAVLAVFVARPRRRIGPATVEYLKAFAVVLIGGFAVSGLAYDNAFLVNARDFWGVKALLLGPPLIAAAVATWHSLGRPGLADTRATLELPIRIWHVAAFAIAAGVIGYLLLRSDNTGAASQLELAFRQQLEDLFYVRPRTKEFLIGFPALLVGILLAWRSPHGWWFYALAAVGTGSAIDTFIHFHAPLVASLLRTTYGVVIGYVLGLVALGLLALLARGARRLMPRLG